MKRYNVRIILEEITVEANSEEEANEKAADIFYGDVHTQLEHGLTIIDFETEEL